MYRYVLLGMISLLTFFGCKEKPQPIPEEEKKEIIPLIHHEAYVVMVDNLRMRNGAGRQTDVLRKLAEGTIVLSNGIVSDFTEKISLRGNNYDEPYHKIYLKNDPETEGWVYGGAIMKIYHDQHAYPFSSNLDGLLVGLVKKDKSTLASASEIIQTMQKETAGDQHWNDALFIMSNYYIDQISKDPKVLNQIESATWTNEDYNQIVAREYPYETDLAKAVKEAGMYLYGEEGSIYVHLDTRAIADRIGGPYSDVVKDYIDIRYQEEKQQLISDAAIKVPIERLIDIYGLKQAFIDKHQERDLYYSKIESEIDNMKYLILNGTGNTPAYDRLDNTQISSNFRQGWEYLIKQYPQDPLVEEVTKRLNR